MTRPAPTGPFDVATVRHLPVNAPKRAGGAHAAGRTQTRRARAAPHLEQALTVALDVVALLAAMRVSGHGRSLIAGLFAILALVCILGFGGYRSRLHLSALDDAPRLAESLAVALVAVTLVAWVGHWPHDLVRMALIAWLALLGTRFVMHPAFRQLRRQGLLQRTVIIGAGHIGIELHRLLCQHPEYGAMPAGIVDDVAPPPGIPLLGPVTDLESVLDQERIRKVIVAFGPGGEQRLVATLRATVQRDVEVCVVPRFFELGLAPAGHAMETVWGIPLYRIRRGALRRSSWWTKRLFDAMLSGLLLLALSPLLAIVAIAVRLASPGPILFRQKRIGQQGREFELLKFRTMVVNADADTTWSVDNDPRVTPVGRWLRQFSLDEIPQFWNVLKGDMALVGPRPERPHFVAAYVGRVDGYGDRHRLPVGLTGLAQIHGLRGDTSIVERARFDNFYIEHWSPWQDAKILLRTGAAVLRAALAPSPAPDEAGILEESTSGSESGARAGSGPATAPPLSIEAVEPLVPTPSRQPRTRRRIGSLRRPGGVAALTSIGERSLLVSGNLALGALLLGGGVQVALLVAVVVPLLAALVRRPQRGVLLLVALAPFDGLLDILPHPGWASGWKEGLTVAVLGTTFFAPASARAAGDRTLPRWLPALGCLLAVSLASAAAVGGSAALFGLKISFFYLLIAWAIWRCPLNAAERDRTITILFVTALMAALYGLAQQKLGPVRLNQMGYGYNTTIRFAGGLLRSFSSFVQPFGFGFYEMAVMLIGLGVVLADPKRLRSRLFLLCMPVLFAGMLTSVVRGAWLGFGAGVLYLALRRHRVLLLMIPLLLIGVLLLPSKSTTQAALSSTSSRDRTSGWGERAQIVMAHPFGVGIGSTGAAAEKAQLARGVVDPDYYTPDNQFFLTLYELGVLGLWGLLLLFWSIMASLRRADRALPGADGALAAGVSAMVVAAAAASLSSSYLQIFPLDVLWWVLIPVVATISAPRPASLPSEPDGSEPRVAAMVR